MTFLEKTIVGKKVLHPVVPADLSEDFRRAFRQTIQKLLLLQKGSGHSQPTRYLSKNNANISRLAAITTLFPDATIIIPFRNPLIHIQSLMNQHERFLATHSTSSFSRRYMKWIGHYEFGANLRPIDFDGTYDASFTQNHVDYNFWMNYWSKAYKHCIAESSRSVYFLDFDNLLQDGSSVLARVGEASQIENMDGLFRGALTLRAFGSSPIAIGDLAPEVWKEAQIIYDQLCQRRL